MCDGDVERFPLLHRWISLWQSQYTHWAPRRGGWWTLVMLAPTGIVSGCTVPPWSDGDGGSQGCCRVLGSIIPTFWWGWQGGDSSVGRCHRGQMGLWEGWWRGVVPGCRGRMQMARGGMLLCCYQSAAALLSAAASPGCKSDLNKAEDFSARSGLAVGIRSGDSVATGRPCVPAGCVKGV